jgi:gliding motility-associated-like protein
VLDQTNCVAYDTIEVSDPDELLGDFVINQTSCYDTADGSVLLNATGGNGDYYFRYNGIWVEGNEIYDLPAGEIDLEIFDFKGCVKDTSITIPQPDSLDIIEISRIAPSCPDAPDGEITVQANGGNGGYSYRWINQDIFDPTLSEIKQNNYRVMVQDSMNCTTERIYNIIAEIPACLDIPSAFSPNSDGVNDNWDILSELYLDTDITTIYPDLIIKVFNRWGQVVWISDSGYSSPWRGNDNGGRPLPVDSYHYIVYLNNGSGVSVSGIITLVK